ncbi:hypothetical protein CY35_02G119800 [Sphagnum magellanicum]|nr:hypothetical protein CY35_02G119800 [Sphagnum magellanicum]
MGRSYMLLISSPSMSLVVALLMMFVSDVLSQTELVPVQSSCVEINTGTSDAEVNALTALYTEWSILSATRGDKCPEPCFCGWEGVICEKLVYPVAPGHCTGYTHIVFGLELVGLGLRGHLSGAIGNLTNLQILTITGNPGLTGNLPSEIGSLSNLIILDLHDNNFTGVIPNLARLTNLEILYLNGNAFSGSIEHVFQGLNTTFFARVDLSSNQLTGCIPGLTTGLGNFSGFSGTLLNVSHNHIGGYFSLSYQMGPFFLTTLDLSFNNISGDISTQFCGRANSSILGTLCFLEIL